MRKLIVSMNVTLDGFMSAPDCGLDWHFRSWTSEMALALNEQLAGAGTILMGRVTYLAMSRYWPAKAADICVPREDFAFIEMMNRCHKAVISNTLKTAGWHNSELLRGNPADAIMELKARPGKSIIIFGSGQLVSALSILGLVDEFQLWLHPVIIGKGKPLFRQMQRLELLKRRAFSSGVVLLTYNPVA